MLRRLLAVAAMASTLVVAVPAAPAAKIGPGWAGTNRGDDARTGWYPSPAAPTPLSVATNFGTLFRADLGATVLAQPVVADGSLIVATEADVVAALDPSTGVVRWTRTLGVPVDASSDGCGDISPVRGVTATPVVDPRSGDVVLVDEEQRQGHTAFFAHRIDPTTGADRVGFPVLLGGDADNQPGTTFDADAEMQRPGLLLLGGVVYAAFASHCDQKPYDGWVAGISLAGRVTTLFATEPGRLGEGGIWQSGAGLSSDGPGEILLTTGNGPAAAPGTTGDHPGHRLGSAALRLEVTASGHLRARDFFAPYDQTYLSQVDADFGSGGLVVLPASMGTPTTPRLAVTGSKAGWLYLLDRTNLGGTGTGRHGGDAVVDRINLGAKILSTPSASPVDDLLYVSTVGVGVGVGSQRQLVALRIDRTGATPRLVVVARSPAELGFGSSSPSISSRTGIPGTSLAWVVRCGGEMGATCADASLDVFDAVPVDGHLTELASWPTGGGSKFAQPLVWGKFVFVATANGVMGIGRRAAPAIEVTSTLVPSGSAIAAGATGRGTLTLTAPTPVTLSSLTFSSSAITADPEILASAGATASASIVIPLRVDTTTLAAQGESTSEVAVVTSGGSTTLPLVVNLTSPGPLLLERRPAQLLSFGGVSTGHRRQLSGTLTNIGQSDLTVTGVSPLPAPFAFVGDPLLGRIVAPGESVAFTVMVTGAGARGLQTASGSISTTGGSAVLHLVANVAGS